MVNFTKLEEKINREIDRRKYGLEFYILSQNFGKDNPFITKIRGDTTRGYDCADSVIKIALILLEEGIRNFTIWEGISEDGIWRRHFFIEVDRKVLDGSPPYPLIGAAHGKIKAHEPSKIWEQMKKYNFVPLTGIVPIKGEFKDINYFLLRAGLDKGVPYSDVLIYRGEKLSAIFARRYSSLQNYLETLEVRKKISSDEFKYAEKMFESESIKKLVSSLT